MAEFDTINRTLILSVAALGHGPDHKRKVEAIRRQKPSIRSSTLYMPVSAMEGHAPQRTLPVSENRQNWWTVG